MNERNSATESEMKRDREERMMRKERDKRGGEVGEERCRN